MGRLTKAKLAAKARNAARKKGIKPSPTTDCGSPNKPLPEVAEATGTTEPVPVKQDNSLSLEEHLKVHVIPNANHPENQVKSDQVVEENQQQITEALPEQNPRRAEKLHKCCDEGKKVKAKKRQPRCSPFTLWAEEVQRQMAADPKPPQIGSTYKQLLKKWSRLPRLQKTYWKHRASLTNEASRKKECSEREKKERPKKSKATQTDPQEKKCETLDLVVEMLPVKNEPEDPATTPQPVVLVYSAYTLWLLNLRRSVSPEMSDRLGSGSKLAARLWDGLPMKEKIAWNNRAFQVNGLLRYGWEQATTYEVVRKFVLGEKKESNATTNEEPTQLSITNVRSLAEPVIVKQEPVQTPAEAIGCIKLFSDSLTIVGDSLKDFESPDVASKITWLVGSLHSTLEPLSALAHGMNLSALQGNVEQLRKLFQQQKL
uniref:(northern house mosquito) hypothetical protein n=1 Tax=Culex pipiens TaxID=7175 RepID=A0A8D8FTB8_CULPI